MHPPDDLQLAALLEEAAIGQKSRFVELVGELGPWLELALSRMGLGPSDVVEGARDVLAQLWREAPSYDPYLGPPTCWALSLVREWGLARMGRKTSSWQPLPSYEVGLEADPRVRALASLPLEVRDRLERFWYRGEFSSGEQGAVAAALEAYVEALRTVGGT